MGAFYCVVVGCGFGMGGIWRVRVAFGAVSRAWMRGSVVSVGERERDGVAGRMALTWGMCGRVVVVQGLPGVGDSLPVREGYKALKIARRLSGAKPNRLKVDWFVPPSRASWSPRPQHPRAEGSGDQTSRQEWGIG